MAQIIEHREATITAESELDSATSAQIVRTARVMLGARIATYVAGQTSSRALAAWVDGAAVPPQVVVDRLRAAVHTVFQLEQRESRRSVQAWFVGANPLLGGLPPASVLREARSRSAYDSVTRAAANLLQG